MGNSPSANQVINQKKRLYLIIYGMDLNQKNLGMKYNPLLRVIKNFF